MKFNYVFKHINQSVPLQKYVSEKMESQINKYVSKPIGARVIFSENKLHKVARCQVYAGDGFNLSAHAASQTNFYGAVDGMVHKLKNQMKRHKDCLKAHHKRDIPKNSSSNEEEEDFS